MITLKNVTKNFGDLVAVNNLNLEISEGEIFGFLGPNGAGKTTTIKMLAGILRPSRGQICINRINIQENPTAAKKIIGYIPDDPFLYEKLSGLEFLEFVGSLFFIPKQKLEHKFNQLLNIFPIHDILERPLGEYSRGNRQRIAILAALLHDPKILLIDEPVVGLDPYSIKTIKSVFKSLAKIQKTTFFMSTHTLNIAEELCDRIGFIHKGKLISLGTIPELRKKAHMEDKSFEDLYLKLTL